MPTTKATSCNQFLQRIAYTRFILNKSYRHTDFAQFLDAFLTKRQQKRSKHLAFLPSKPKPELLRTYTPIISNANPHKRPDTPQEINLKRREKRWVTSLPKIQQSLNLLLSHTLSKGESRLRNSPKSTLRNGYKRQTHTAGAANQRWR